MPGLDRTGRGRAKHEPSSAFARRWSAPGALERVWRRSADGGESVLEAYQRASLALAAAARDVPQRWNDAADRRLDEVLDVLALAVDRLRPALSSPLEPVRSAVGAVLGQVMLGTCAS